MINDGRPFPPFLSLLLFTRMTSNRLSDTLSSIFLPANSIYADLDTLPPSPARDSSSSPHHQSPPLIASEEHQDDPFHSDSPSVLSPVTPLSQLPLQSDPNPHTTPNHHLSDSVSPFVDHEADDYHHQSPFQAQPADEEEVEDETPGASLYLPARGIQTPPAAPPISLSPPPASSAATSRAGLGLGRSGGSGASGGVAGSTLGNRSLMNLLGGTRTFEPMGSSRGGFPFSGVGEEDEEEEEEAFGRGESQRCAFFLCHAFSR
jgi:hypothetical protein